MKSILLITSLAASLITSVAVAETTETSLQKVEASQNTDQSSAVENTEIKKQTRIEKTGTDYETGRSKYSISLFSIGGIDRSQLTNGSGQQSMYFFEDFLAFGYKVSKDFKLAARYSFNYSTAGTDKFGKDVTDKSDTRDMSLLMTWYNVFEDQLPSNVSFKFQPRLYLPTSDKSKAQGTISALRFENELKIYVGKYSNFRIWSGPIYSFQRATAYTDDKGYIKTTDMFNLKQGAEFYWSLSKTFGLVPGFEVDDNWSNASPVNAKNEYHTTSIDYRLGLDIKVARPLSFMLGYSHKRDLIKIGEFADGFTLMTNATLF